MTDRTNTPTETREDLCPDCEFPMGVLDCSNCGLSWEDIKAGAEMFDRLLLEVA